MRYRKHGSVLTAHGYDTTPLKGKVPILKGWQARPEAAKDFQKYASANIGIVLGGAHNIVAADIDVKHEAAAAAVKALAVDILGAAPERIGAAPKTMLVYRASVPTNKRKTAIYEIDGEDACVEILAEGQQFVASGIHPDTKEKYKWPGDSLLDYLAVELPLVTGEDISEFLAAANTVLGNHGKIKARSLSNGRDHVKSGLDLSPEPQQADYTRVSTAMQHINNDDAHYDDWVYVGHAIKGALADADEARQLFHCFSKKSSKYEISETDRLWNSLGEIKKIGAGTIFRMAADNGYIPLAVAPIVPDTEIFKSWQPTDANDIPAREFLFGAHYIRKFVSGTVAPGGIGKSTLALFEAIAMAARLMEYGCKDSDLKVAYYNAEDPFDEIQRRIIAMCQHLRVNQNDLVNRLFIASGRDADVYLANGEQGVINEKVFEFLADMIDRTGADVLILDPLANMTTSPETNEVFRPLGARLSALADTKNISIEIVHHTRKLQSGGEANHEDARGGGALVNGMRSVRVLNNMTPGEAPKAGLETHVDHFRIEDGKANLARRSERAIWWRKVSIELENGDNVVAIEPWEWPDPYDNFTREEIARGLMAIQEKSDPLLRREYHTSDGWCGEIICRMKAAALDGVDDVEAAAWREAAQIKKAKTRSPIANQFHNAAKTLLDDLTAGNFIQVVWAKDQKGTEKKCLQRTEKHYEMAVET